MTEKEPSNEELEQLIQEEIAKTKNLIEVYTIETQPVAPDCSIDLLSRNEAMNNLSRMNALLEQAKTKLGALEFTLSKVGTPEFGKCVRCKKEIPIERIMVRPESLFCIECSD